MSNDFVSRMHKDAICHSMTDGETEATTERLVERNGTIYSQKTRSSGELAAIALIAPPPLCSGYT